MAHRHFCTYFDHRYLARGLALHESLRAHCADFTLWVLALDQLAVRHLERLAPDNLRVVPLEALEAADAELKAARANRSLIEYYFTCSPCLPRQLFATHADIDAVTYLDSDLFFFSSPEPIFAELEPYSTGITPHRFSARAERSHGRYGKYNVGWLTFRRDRDGIACLSWWREQCLQWCFDRVEGTRYADQGYLNSFEAKFAGVHAIAHPGANLAPWNIANHRIVLADGKVTVDGSPLVFFHFQGLREVNPGVWDSNLGGYGARLDAIARDHVFRPYLKALLSWRERLVAGQMQPAEIGSIRRDVSGLAAIRKNLGRRFYAMRAALAGNLVRP